MRKLKIKYVLLMILLCDTGAFGASEATKQLINRTLAKYGISAGGKEICGTGRDTEYNKSTGVVKCKNDADGDSNNCWDKDSRLCKECPKGKVVSQRDYTTCRELKCPEGYELVEVKNGVCPNGFELKPVSSCDTNFVFYSESEATNNYTTQSINCKNVN